MASPGSIMESISQALTRMGRILFRNADLSKWFVLGFCAWLVQVGQGVLSGGLQIFWNLGTIGPASTPKLPSGFADIVDQHLPLIIAGCVGAVLLLLAVYLLTLWLNCRGTFIFLHNIVCNREDVVAPWFAYRRQGNSLFVFHLALSVLFLLLFLIVIALAAAIAWPDIEAERWHTHANAALIVGAVLGGLLSLAAAALSQVLDDFVAPIMYYEDSRALAALQAFWGDVLRPHVGLVLLFYLVKFVLGAICGTIVSALVVATLCALCCVMQIPVAGSYVMAVVLLPITVFLRCYSLFFLAQFRPAWALQPKDLPTAVADTLQPPSPATDYQKS